MKILQKWHYSYSYIYTLWACHWIGSNRSHTACGCLSCTVGCSFIWYPAALAANLLVISCMFESSLVICRHVSFERPKQPVISWVVLFWSLLTSFSTFCTFIPVQPLEGWAECSQSSNEVFPPLNQESQSSVCGQTMELSLKGSFTKLKRKLNEKP